MNSQINLYLTVHSFIYMELTIAFVVAGLFLINRIWFIKTMNIKGRELYECGFQPQDYERKPVNIKYFMLCLRFLIFDLELIRLIPMVSSIKVMAYRGFLTTLVYFRIINVGYLYEWIYGTIKR